MGIKSADLEEKLDVQKGRKTLEQIFLSSKSAPGSYAQGDLRKLRKT